MQTYSKTLFASFTDWLLYTSVFAAFCAVALAIGTESLLLRGVPGGFSFLHLFIFGATLVVYNTHFLISHPDAALSDRYAWTKKHRIWHFAVVGTGIALCLLSLPYLGKEIIVTGFILGGLSFAYTLPLLPGKKKASLREIGWFKLLLLTSVWTTVTAIMPIFYWGKDISDYPFEILMRFVFMLSLCIAFDIRDMQTDLQGSIYTLPNLIGVKGSYYLIYSCIGLFIFLSLVQFYRFGLAGRLITAVLISAATIVVVLYARRHPSDKAYLGFVDGMMLLYGCLIALCSYYN